MATYKTIITTYGNNLIASAINNTSQIKITEIAVGDGGGSPITPVASMTQLANEVFRTNINNITQDVSDSSRVIFEGIIPADQGGFTVREMGLFDEHGNLFAVANTPDIPKPTITEGAIGDVLLRMVIEVADPSVINMSIDPNVVVVTVSHFPIILQNELNNVDVIVSSEY